MRLKGLIPMLCALMTSWGGGLSQGQDTPVVEIEEDVYTYVDSNNGSFPLWTYGSTILARVGNDLFFSATETIPDAEPLNCVRWALMKRTPSGWEVQQSDLAGHTRENCPIGCLADGQIFLSVNPTLVPDQRNGPAQPQVLEFSAADPKAPYQTLLPVWEGEAPFTEHSYRGFAVDAANGELLLVNVEGYRGQHWSFRDREGKWSAHGLVEFPSFDSYKGPLPMRYLYPSLGLRDRAAHMFTKGGLEEPNEQYARWRAEQKSGIWARPSLGYAWTPNIAQQPFSAWIEAVNVRENPGEAWNCDLWVAPDGDCHLLWWESSIDARLRPKFLSEVPLTYALKHGVMRNGEMAFSEVLAEGGEGLRPCNPRWGRFHATADGRLFVFYWEQCTGGDNPGDWNRIIEIKPDGSRDGPVTVELEHPFTMLFMVAGAYGGTPPSDTLEVVGRCVGTGNTIRYARIRLAG